MTTLDLSGKRVLLLGAETDLGGEIARGLAEAGASLALIAASNDPQTAFAVQRLARKLGAPVSQAIDATNEMAVRVMVRQVSKELAGLDAVVFTGISQSGGYFYIQEFAGRAFAKLKVSGVFISAAIDSRSGRELDIAGRRSTLLSGRDTFMGHLTVVTRDRDPKDVAKDIVSALTQRWNVT